MQLQGFRYNQCPSYAVHRYCQIKTDVNLSDVFPQDPQTLINYMEYSLSWVADSSMGSQEIAHIVWNFKTHYHVHNSLPPVPILRQMNEVHTLPYCYCKNPSIPVSSKWSLSFMSSLPPGKNPVCISVFPHSWGLPHTSHFPWFDHLNKQTP